MPENAGFGLEFIVVFIADFYVVKIAEKWHTFSRNGDCQFE